MGFRDRLARLQPAGLSRETLLDDLRTRMRRVLERTAPVSRGPVVTAEDTDYRLPFFAEDTELGVRHRRVARLSAAHRTGTRSVQGAKDADCTLLSLLALDPAIAQLDPS